MEKKLENIQNQTENDVNKLKQIAQYEKENSVLQSVIEMKQLKDEEAENSVSNIIYELNLFSQKFKSRKKNIDITNQEIKFYQKSTMSEVFFWENIQPKLLEIILLEQIIFCQLQEFRITLQHGLRPLLDTQMMQM
jgi:hypothetical protein